MKPYVIVGYVREHFQEVMYQDVRGLARHSYSTSTPNTGGMVVGDNSQPNPLYFATTDAEAERVAMGLSRKFSNYNWLIAKTTALVDMPPRNREEMPEIKVFSEKGVLP